MLLSFASIGWIWKGCCWSKGWRGHEFGYFWDDNQHKETKWGKKKHYYENVGQCIKVDWQIDMLDVLLIQ